jgi:predicted amidohydrolase
MTSIRVSAVPFKAGPVRSFSDFADHAARCVEQAAARAPDFLVFPELFTAELMNFFDGRDIVGKFARLTKYTGDYVSLFRGLARDKGFYILAGSHLTESGGRFYNTGHMFTPDGQVWEQKKCHLVPLETAWTTPGDGLHVFETEKVKLGILTCYDLEFPESARLVTLKGAELLLSPSATLDEPGYWRVRHCGHARAIEDQVYVVHCSLLGNAAGIPFWGMASVLTPCDTGFPAKGIAAESPLNEEAVITADLDLARLHEHRERGTVTTLKDRRWDVIEALHAFEGRQPEGSRAKDAQTEDHGAARCGQMARGAQGEP